MTKRSSRSGTGGGIGSRIVTKQPVRTGQPAREMRHKGVSQIGSSLGDHATDAGGKALTRSVEPVRGQRMASVALGNEVAKNVGGGGPGAGRTVMKSGTQAQHGPAAGTPKPAGRDILGAFGNESPGVRDRR
jgi:hypothetical protein